MNVIFTVHRLGLKATKLRFCVWLSCRPKPMLCLTDLNIYFSWISSSHAEVWVMLWRSPLNSRFGWEFWQEQTTQSAWMTRKKRISQTLQPSIFTSILAVLQNTHEAMTFDACRRRTCVDVLDGEAAADGRLHLSFTRVSHSFFMHFGVLCIPFRGETI